MGDAGGRSGDPLVTSRSSALPRSRRALVLGAIGSVLLLAAAVSLQAAGSSILNLPAQWLAVAAVPVVIGLVYGRYISRFSFAGLEVEAPPLKPLEYVEPGTRPEGSKTAIASQSDWTAEREAEYQRTHRLELVHIYKPSTRSGQKHDISIYLVRDDPLGRPSQTTNFTEVEQAEFFFGETWGNRIFTTKNNGGVIGINTSAWGTFLATCRVTFRDGSSPVVLHRYIDFEMATLIATAFYSWSNYLTRLSA